MVTLGGPSLHPSKLIILTILDALWVYGTLGAILTSIVSNSHFGKRPVARAMKLFSPHFPPNVTNHVFSY